MHMIHITRKCSMHWKSMYPYNVLLGYILRDMLPALTYRKYKPDCIRMYTNISSTENSK